MKIYKLFTLILCISSIFLTSHAYAKTYEKSEIIGKTFYTQHNLWYEDFVHKSVNYLIGICIPINTKVKILAVKKNKMIISMDSGDTELKIVNIPDFSGVDIMQLFNRMFSIQKTDFGKYKSSILNNERINKIAVGMSKQDVIKAVGYPPAHKTKLESNVWRYWVNRFNVKGVRFKSGKVVEVFE